MCVLVSLCACVYIFVHAHMSPLVQQGQNVHIGTVWMKDMEKFLVQFYPFTISVNVFKNQKGKKGGRWIKCVGRRDEDAM